MMSLDQATGSRFAALVLGHVRLEYPNKLDHVLNGPADLSPPSALHPVFYGSFDWHSNVHGYWLLATLYRRLPMLVEAEQIRSLFDEQFTTEKVRIEVEYVRQPSSGTFERPYGWAWLLMLAAELARHDSPEAGTWREALLPLAREFAARFRGFLPKASYPIRVGTHFNTAFALSLALEFAQAYAADELAAMLRDKARAWYINDRDCQAWEPSGDDFLSSALIEAECMRRVLERDEWRSWMNGFLPRIPAREPRTLFVPANVSDRSDGKIAHLDGLNLSRAWCWRNIAACWPREDPRRAIVASAADEHLAASLSHVADDYAGSHWLATYALMALLARDAITGP